MTETSALYVGDVVHRRHRPKHHQLRYRVFSLLVDLDELDMLDRRLTLFGYNRAAAISFWDRDHGAGDGGCLRQWVEGHLSKTGVSTSSIRIRVLCYPRVFGYVFNPLTVYFCERPDGQLVCVLYEVRNTVGECHTYILPVANESGPNVEHSCAKKMYVSPFMPMDCIYKFRIQRTAEHVRVAIDESDGDGPLLYAGFTGKRKLLTDRALARVLLALPLMTIKVTAGIYWEALRLWLKGVPVYRHEPQDSRRTSSFVSAKE